MKGPVKMEDDAKKFLLAHPRTKDLTGQRFGHLVVVKLDHFSETYKRMFWEVRCDCGRTIVEDSRVSVRTGKKHCSTDCSLLSKELRGLRRAVGGFKTGRQCKSCDRSAAFGSEFCYKCTHIDATVPVDKPVGYHRPVSILYIKGNT
jgi:hypothetical protein